MCGIFAFTGPAGPDLDVLTEAARGAAQRGPHGHGWAGSDIDPHHQLGLLDTADLASITTTRLIGHARLATVGAYHDTNGLQPVGIDGHWFAHNGTVTNHQDLWPGASTDTIALAHVYAGYRRHGAPSTIALELVVKQARHHAWAVVVLDANGALVAHRHGLPLWQHTDNTGIYWSSRAWRDATCLPADQVSEVPAWPENRPNPPGR